MSHTTPVKSTENEPSSCPDAPNGKSLSLSKYLLEKTQGKKERVKEAMELIKQHKRKQKMLYRSYYLMKEELQDWINEFKGQGSEYELLKLMCELDESDIFYEKRAKTMNV